MIVDGRVHEIGPMLNEPAVLPDVQAVLELPDDAVERLRGIAPDSMGGGIELSDVRLLPPILRPPAIRDHIAFEEHATRQFTRPVADVWRRRPLHYYSNPSRLVGQNGMVTLPATERLDYELELAAVIGRECSDVSESAALDYVLGFTIMNDWSARDLQADEMAYGLGPAKGKDFATSLGPWVVTTDELLPFLVDGVLRLDCRVRVNGVTWAESTSAAMFHSWGAMVEHASQDSRLLPGDVLGSGTVAGGCIGEAIRKGYPAAVSGAG